MKDINFENLLEDFNILDSWEDKYKYIIDLGKELEPYPDAFRTDDHRVLGCASQVWFYPIISKVEGKTFFSFKGDSDAIIVKGLIQILFIIYNNKDVSVLKGIDPFVHIKTLGLEEHLTSQRANGLKSMIVKIQEEVSQHI